jgi:hypothetical protein
MACMRVNVCACMLDRSVEAYEHERVRMEESMHGLRRDLEAALRHGSEARAHAGRLAKELADAEGKMLRALEERDRLRDLLQSECAGRAAEVVALKKSLEAEKARADYVPRLVSACVPVGVMYECVHRCSQYGLRNPKFVCLVLHACSVHFRL